ncbi:MAG: hypothetical protein HC802_17445 [Caldilineaceae bacterium]|nr:hypothetical protein [Caldilineaceae bacterium]
MDALMQIAGTRIKRGGDGRDVLVERRKEASDADLFEVLQRRRQDLARKLHLKLEARPRRDTQEQPFGQEI